MARTTNTKTVNAVVKTATLKEGTVEEKDTKDLENVNTKETVQPKQTIRKFEADELIEVQSVTQGELLLPGKKSGILYRWSNYGDITEVEYQDLYTLKSSRSDYIYKPMFQILNDELLEDGRWKDVKKLYEQMISAGDIYEIMKLPNAQFKQVLMTAPKGIQDAIKIEVASRIENDTMDSISKIKTVDEICGTDLFSILK